MDSLIAQIFNGLSLGSILLLSALGLAFSFGLMKVINMAHGEFIMVGAYVTYVMQQFIAPALGGEQAAKNGIFFMLSIPAAFFVTSLLGYFLETTLIRRLYGRPLDTLLATWGVGLILQQLARSYDSRNVPVTSPDWLNGALVLSPTLAFPYKRLFIIALVIVCVIGIYFMLYRSAYGRRIRAVMQNREIASALGTATRRVDSYTFALGAGLAGVAGCALTLLGQIGPQLGTGYIVDAFMVVVLGGVGSLPGTISAAFIIGILNTFFEFNTTATLGKVLVFIFIIAFLQWRPGGLVAVRSRT
ncbi:MAG TPA: urea ABC transporter permease subunit UrtB [Phototrophicaceae bacterium]|jgi:urea transport system permease protein|nr:urea ABC transporter permease subunit UrtB [Phototrophicaceae bacterium]